MRYVFRGAVAALCLLPLPAAAAVLAANAATLKAVFAAARPGDTIRLSGSFGQTNMSNRTFATTLTIDARAATFTGTLSFNSVGNIRLIGGHYGSATDALQGIRVMTSDQVQISSPTVVGNHQGSHGIDIASSTHVSVDGGSFTDLRAAVTFTRVTFGRLSGNKSLASSSDGFDIAGSHKITVTGNTCSGTAILAGNHPDCVQLWSLPGEPRNSDITISNNTAIGATQGFTSFDPDAGGGVRIAMTGNRVDTSYPQGIACYACDDSIFTGNILTTQPGSSFRTGINIVGGNRNTISGNSVQAYVRAGNSAALGSALGFGETSALVDIAVEPLDQGELIPLATGAALTGEVPEPGVWALLIAGFALTGAGMRRRRAAA